MPLAPAVSREEIHTRAITVKSYRRSDGLFDVEGHLTDVRPYPVKLPSGMREGGEPIHDMWLRLTVDVNALVVAVEASTDGAPYGKTCASIAPAYGALVGKHVGRGFRGAVRSAVGGLKGCTHLSELLLVMGTCVIQALFDARPHPEDIKPFSLDGCHALDTGGPVVAEFYPRWYRRPEAGTSHDTQNDEYTLSPSARTS